MDQNEGFYTLSTPYLKKQITRYIDSYINDQNNPNNFKKQVNTKTDDNQKKNILYIEPPKISTVSLIRRNMYPLLRLDACDEHKKFKFFTHLRDKFGRIILSLSSSTRLFGKDHEKKLFFIYTDGKDRKKAFSLLNLMIKQRELKKNEQKKLQLQSISNVTNKEIKSPKPPSSSNKNEIKSPKVLSNTTNNDDQIAYILGGSLGLNNLDMLGDKIQMANIAQDKDYIPWTKSFTIIKDNLLWKEEILYILQANNQEYIILKPSNGQQQRGILICQRLLSNKELIYNHCTSELKGGPYYSWVVQKYIMNPLCLSGLKLGSLTTPPTLTPFQMKKSPIRKYKVKENNEQVKEFLLTDEIEKQEQKQQKDENVNVNETDENVTVNEPEEQELKPEKKAEQEEQKPEKKAQQEEQKPEKKAEQEEQKPEKKAPAFPNKKLHLPSDSGQYLHKDKLYKIHFRYYAIVLYDIHHKNQYELYGCNLLKIYHSKDEYIADSCNFEQNISKYLAMRLAHEIFNQDQMLYQSIIQQIHHIIIDIIETAIIQHNGLLPFGYSQISFQNLGFDFLYDLHSNQVMLLEININPGQGVMSKQTMCIQQYMSHKAYQRLYDYWDNVYKTCYINGLMNICLSKLLFLNIQYNSSLNSFKLLKVIHKANVIYKALDISSYISLKDQMSILQEIQRKKSRKKIQKKFQKILIVKKF